MNELISLGADDSKVHWHPVGVNLDMFHKSCDEGSEDNMVTITTVARLVEEKDVETAIRAIAELPSTALESDIRYRIVGDGPKRESLENLTRKLDLDDVVQFEGQVKREKVIKFLSGTDIFLLTSVDEAFGLALLEAQAAEIPVVATNVGGIPEAVAAGDSAILVPPRSPDQTAEQLVKLYRQPALRSEMGEEGHRFVAENFDVDVLNDKFEALLKRIGEHSRFDEQITHKREQR
jgi:colanic acid/amylovoran biosynthesis glycosyltransferase